MRELLWRPDDEELPTEDRDYYELRLEETPGRTTYSYSIWRIRYEWSRDTRRMEPADEFAEFVKTLAEAEDRYAVHLKILADLGFTVSDMGPVM